MEEKPKIIVTGGLGYIGSHCAVELISNGYGVVLVDDLSNSSKKVLYSLESITNTNIEFEEIDLKNEKLVKNLFLRDKIVLVCFLWALIKRAITVIAETPYASQT